MSKQRTATDVLLNLEKRIEESMLLLKSLDFATKLYSNKISALEKKIDNMFVLINNGANNLKLDDNNLNKDHSQDYFLNFDHEQLKKNIEDQVDGKITLDQSDTPNGNRRTSRPLQKPKPSKKSNEIGEVIVNIPKTAATKSSIFFFNCS